MVNTHFYSPAPPALDTPAKQHLQLMVRQVFAPNGRYGKSFLRVTNPHSGQFHMLLIGWELYTRATSVQWTELCFVRQELSYFAELAEGELFKGNVCKGTIYADVWDTLLTYGLTYCDLHNI